MTLARNDEKYSETRGNSKGAETDNLSLSPLSGLCSHPCALDCLTKNLLVVWYLSIT